MLHPRPRRPSSDTWNDADIHGRCHCDCCYCYFLQVLLPCLMSPLQLQVIVVVVVVDEEGWWWKRRRERKEKSLGQRFQVSRPSRVVVVVVAKRKRAMQRRVA